MMCTFRWYGPRVDVPEADAMHVCGEDERHTTPHECVCGALNPFRGSSSDWPKPGQ